MRMPIFFLLYSYGNGARWTTTASAPDMTSQAVLAAQPSEALAKVDPAARARTRAAWHLQGSLLRQNVAILGQTNCCLEARRPRCLCLLRQRSEKRCAGRCSKTSTVIGASTPTVGRISSMQDLDCGHAHRTIISTVCG
jgi:hypothetical protein